MASPVEALPEGPTRPHGQVPPPTRLQHRQSVLEETRTFIASDLRKLFDSGIVTTSRYAADIKFEDPLTKHDTLEGYLFNIRLLRTLFNVAFDVHSVKVSGPDELTARWTMAMEFWLLPWKPELLFTGKSFYQVDADSGTILAHRDVWDAIQNNRYLSLEGVQHVLKMFLEVQLTPSGLETPKYRVLKKLKGYEVREYNSFTVAEVAMAPGSSPAGGSGFTDLAGYIFGANQEGVKMEMTTPVFTAPGPIEGNSRMQFVAEQRFGEVDMLPGPNNARIERKREAGGFYAATRFSGWPLDFEVAQAERQLRAALLRDGLKPTPGYRLARYNEPTVPPFVRRNEVLIRLPDFKLQ